MAYEFIKVDREGPVTIFTLNRPEVMNALHSPMHFELDEAFNAFAAHPDQWVGIVTGAGERAFSAGNDLKHQAMGGDMKSPPSGFAGLTSRFDLTCALIIASETAPFALPEPRVGLAALAGGLHRLPRAIGTKRALGMILTGRRVSAAHGYELGFVNEVTPPQELMATARKWAAEICELSPMSIRASKEAVFKGLDEPSLEAAIKGQMRYPAAAALFKSEDFVEGPMAFAQKRAPAWKGR